MEITEVVLVYCNIVNNNYQQKSRVLYMFVSNKSFGRLLDIFPKKKNIFRKIYSEFSYIKIWFTNHNSNPLELEE